MISHNNKLDHQPFKSSRMRQSIPPILLLVAVITLTASAKVVASLIPYISGRLF